MKYILNIVLFTISVTCFAQKQKAGEKYVLLRVVKKQNENGKTYKATEVNQKDIDRLSRPLRGLAAYYTCWIQSNCEYVDTNGAVICELTKALGLGVQGSNKQIEMLRQWFPHNKDVIAAIDENCWVGNPGSSHFLEYDDLSFIVNQDIVTVTYHYYIYDHGKTSTVKGKQKAVIRKDRIEFLK